MASSSGRLEAIGAASSSVRPEAMRVPLNAGEGKVYSPAEAHTTLMAKRGELDWLATQSMIQLLAPLSLIDTSKTATGQSFKDLNRQAHFEASDKLHHFVISDPVCLVCRCVAGQQERFRFSMWKSLCWNKKVTVGWKCCSLLSCVLALADFPELHAHLVLQRHNQPRKHKNKPNSFDSCGWKLCKEAMTTLFLTKKSPKWEGVSSLTRKVFLTQFIEANPQPFSCKTKDRRWKVLP